MKKLICNFEKYYFGLRRSLSTLKRYDLKSRKVSQNRMSVKCFCRNSENLWVLYPYKSGDRLELKSIDFTTEIENLYEDVNLTEFTSDRLFIPEN